jgi:colicin import membrane protein
MFKSLGKFFKGLFESEPKELIVKISKENQKGLYETIELAQKFEVEKKKYDEKMAKLAQKEAEKKAKEEAKAAAKKAKEEAKAAKKAKKAA